MILYLDTSALVPLLIDEPTSPACAEIWDAADTVVCTRLAYVEASAALAMAERLGRITEREQRAAGEVLEQLWAQVEVLELGEELMVQSAQLAARHGLRAYDAVHCAAAVQLADDDLVAASGDKLLLAAWRRSHVATFDTSTGR